ncbi:MAG: hypothetical protein EA402_05490 [Planctomycetota bacterium]|nr:MAG: hypothetical protein EA402_05490 [Planctomycetota bacterium]
MQAMRLHFIYPRWRKLLEDHPQLCAQLSAHEVGSLRMTSLGIPTAIAALPAGVTASVCNDHLEDACSVDPAGADAICIGFFTPQASRAYAIAELWRRRGYPIIFGGIHPSACPEECLNHADAVITGPVEGLWETVLADLAAGKLQRRYSGQPCAPFAMPQRGALSSGSQLRIDVLQTSRGCDRQCAFCVVPAVNGDGIQRRDVEAALDDCANTNHPAVFLADENLLHDDPNDVAWAQAFHEGLQRRRLRRWFTAAAYPRTLTRLNSERARAWQQAGLRQLYLICGYMQPLSRELTDGALLSDVLRLQDIGIECLATFTLGNDGDPAAVDDIVLPFWAACGAHLAEVTISVPFPGTARFECLDRQGRLLHRHWERYNGSWCVFVPRHGSPAEVEACSLRLWQSLYAERSRYQVQQAYVRGFGQDILREPAADRQDPGN